GGATPTPPPRSRVPFLERKVEVTYETCMS
ncbi:hypothetical protein A2U01_0109770, partial [Trifolium medium]|nr:hypothetical protein [Trifolium medium]